MENELEVSKVWLDNEFIYIQTSKNKVKSHPISWFPRLLKASKAEREAFVLSPFGIHWEKLDEDLSFEGFFTFTKELVS
jgi:Protein of unknown function (DUF2442)